MSVALAHFHEHPPQGEFTLVLGGAEVSASERPSDADLREQLQALVESGLSRNDAARQLARSTGIAKRELYALQHQDDDTP